MKNLIAFFGIMSISFSTFANVSIEDTSPMHECIQKAERLLSNSAEIAGMGQGVGHMGGMQVLSKRIYRKKNVVYVLGGGALAAKNTDGYMSGSGAVTLVSLTKKSCNILDFQLTTGKNFNRGFELGEKYQNAEVDPK